MEFAPRMNGVLPVFVSITAGSVVLVQQGVQPSTFGELGGWLVGVLILIVGALLTVGIRDFQRSQKETGEKIDKLDEKVNQLHGDFREHLGRDKATDDVARHLAKRLLEKKTTYPRAMSDRGSST